MKSTRKRKNVIHLYELNFSQKWWIKVEINSKRTLNKILLDRNDVYAQYVLIASRITH